MSNQRVKTFWVGLDVSKSCFDAAFYIPDAGKSNVPDFARTREGAAQLLDWADLMVERLAPGATIRIVMEATGCYSAQLFAWLIELRPQCEPCIINPSYIKAFGQSLGGRNKTDKADARVIARYGYERKPAPEQLPDPEYVQLRELVRERSHLVEVITAEKNRKAEAAHNAFIERLRNCRLEALEKQRAQLEKQIRQHVEKCPRLHHDVQLLDSVPGVAFITAVTILAELGDLRRFYTGRKLAAFAGLSPRRHQSGKSEKPTRISRMGNSSVRAVLHLGARSISRCNCTLAAFYKQLVERGKSKNAANAAVSRKMLLLMRCVLITNRPYDPNHLPQQHPMPPNLRKTPLQTSSFL